MIKLYIHHNENSDTIKYFLHNCIDNQYKSIVVNYEFTNDWSKTDGIHIIDFKFYCIEKNIADNFILTCRPICYDIFFDYLQSIPNDDIKVHVFIMEQEYKKSTVKRISTLNKNKFFIFWDKVPTKNNINPYVFLFTQFYLTWILPSANIGLNQYPNKDDRYKNGKYRINFPVKREHPTRIRIKNKILNYNNPFFISTQSNPSWGPINHEIEINASYGIKENNLMYLDKIIPISNCTLISETVRTDSDLIFFTEKTISHIIIGKPFVYTNDDYRVALNKITNLSEDSSFYGDNSEDIVDNLNEIISNDTSWTYFLEKESKRIEDVKNIFYFRLDTENSYLDWLIENKPTIRKFI